MPTLASIDFDKNLRENKLCTAWMVFFTSLLGGPLAACYLISKNFRTFGNPAAAKKILIYGLIFTFLLIALCYAVNPFIPLHSSMNTAIPVAYSLTAKLWVDQYQGKALAQSLQDGIKKYSALKAIGVGICSLILSFGLVILFAELLSLIGIKI